MRELKFDLHYFPLRKRIFYVICSVIVFTFLTSCNDKKEIVGKWDDIIKLSSKYAEFNVKTDSVIIKTEGDWWWVEGISVNDSNYYYHKDIDLESDFYSIKEDCFVVERQDKNTLFIKLNENLTGEDRFMRLVLEAGDYFDYVTIKQAAK
jgi:hypothetical protein